jgi:Ribonuclease G/E
MNKFLEKHPLVSGIVVLSLIGFMLSTYLNPLNKGERFKNYDRQLTQIDSIYNKMVELKSMKNETTDDFEALWTNYYNLGKKADSIKELLPHHYKTKADSIQRKTLEWDCN